MQSDGPAEQCSEYTAFESANRPAECAAELVSERTAFQSAIWPADSGAERATVQLAQCTTEHAAVGAALDAAQQSAGEESDGEA